MAERNLLSVAKCLDSLRRVSQPSAADAETLVTILTTGVAASYFFRPDFDNPSWLSPLAEAGAFQRYARTRAGKRRRWVVFRELTAYLHRVAEAEPRQVADILASLTTRDSWATGQFMKATLALPDECAAQVVPQFVKWCGPGNPFARDEDVITLAQRMLDSRHVAEFQTLLELLLRPVPKSHGSDIGGIFFDDDLIMFIRDRDVYAAFCDSAPFECLTIAERCLRRAVPLRERAAVKLWEDMGMDRGRKPDPSSGIRSAIEEHKQNQFPHFEDGLVVAVRDSLAAYVNRSSAEAEDVIRRYLGSRWSIFRRLALHALTENTERYPKLAKSAVFKTVHGKRFFDDTDLHHEYWRLVPAVFDDLSSNEKARLLRWIDAAYDGADERDKQWFAYRRLTMLENCDLPAHARRRLEELQAQLPKAEHPDFLVYSDSWFGAVSPELPADLKKNLEDMTVDELLEFLDTWRPDPNNPSPFGSSYATMGQELRRLVKGDLSKYQKLATRMSSKAPTLIAHDPERKWATYVGYVLDAYQQACREGKQFDWSGVLALADAVVPEGVPPEQWPDPLPRKTDVPELGYDWCGVRRAVAHLLEVGIGADEAIPESQLTRVRDILIRLVTDRYPQLEDERKHERQNRERGAKAAPLDWHSFAINTTRPEAAHVLLRYAVRHANPIVKEKREEPRVEREVKDALNTLANDPCRSVHAVLGSWLGVLWWLDGNWLIGVLISILPTSRDQHGLWQAAWVAFLQFGTLYPKLHEHLVPHYRRSINQCACRSEEDPHLKALCKHLAAIYTWDWDAASDADTLISCFYASAGEDAASELAEAFGRFARSLDEAGDDAPSYWQRIESLVRRRLDQIRPQAGDHVRELRALGTWLDVFIERGAGELRGMADVLEVITSVPLGHWQFERVVEFLDSQAQAYPNIAARLLRQMLSKCERDAWYWEREKINSVLEKVFASDNSEARRDGVKVIELLWEQGEWEPFKSHRDKIAAISGCCGSG